MISVQKLCDKTKLSNIIVWVFLAILVILCIFGIAGDNKYSCDKGIFVRDDDISEYKDPQKMNNLIGCFSSASEHNYKTFNHCVKKELNGECVEGHLSRIILIVILCLVGLYTLYKLGCTASNNRATRLTEGIPLVTK